MFENVGRKLQIVATILYIIVIAISVIAIFWLLSTSESAGFTLIGFLIIILAALIFWIVSAVLYGYGVSIENSDIIVSELSDIKRMMKKQEIGATKTDSSTQLQSPSNPNGRQALVNSSSPSYSTKVGVCEICLAKGLVRRAHLKNGETYNLCADCISKHDATIEL